jgi:hypothetical protein
MIDTPFTQVPNHFLARLPELNASEMKLMVCIYRNTLGYHRQQVSMTLSEVMRRTGLSRQSVLDARSKAIEHGLLAYTLKDGVILWEPVLQAPREDGLKNGPEAVQNVDHADETVQNIDRDGLTNRPEAVQNLDRDGEMVQNVDRDGLTNRPEAVQNVDHADETVQNIDRDGLKNGPEAVQNLDHADETVQNLDPLLNKDLNKDLKKEREKPRARFSRMILILNGYRVGNLIWLVEWAPRLKYIRKTGPALLYGSPAQTPPPPPPHRRLGGVL